MADSDVYPPCVRQDLQALLTRMLGGTDFFGAVHALSTSFHPSFFLELDWQELRLDRDYSEGPGIYEVIDDFVFAATLPGNISMRARRDEEQGAAFSTWVDSYQEFFEGWRSRWPERYGPLMPELARQAALGLATLGLPARPLTEGDAASVLARSIESLEAENVSSPSPRGFFRTRC